MEAVLADKVGVNEVTSEVEVTRADEIAILSCVHEGIYDLVHTVSYEITFNLPREPSAFFYLPSCSSLLSPV